KPGWMSVDLTPTLHTGEVSPRDSWLYASDAYRSGPFKIHVATSHPTNPETRKGTPPTKHSSPLLFNLEDDIAEKNDIASQHPKIVERLVSEMEDLRNRSN
ncbi:MAG: hypothetical protein AAGF67_17555, partial [Verrucomicrobiota bacterium]